ncbi:unnamed protein product [Durusdinium trenchii]|uniref:Dihydroorotate dehydrogenase catalytic domain-containing protein n=1 Tax=Durusdinium trenchii TaxID=1381693 RepID=A0ABP0KEH9_9DINO
MSARRRLFKGVSAVGALHKHRHEWGPWFSAACNRRCSSRSGLCAAPPKDRRSSDGMALPVVLQTDPETAHNLTLKCGEALQAFRSLWPSLPMEWLLSPPEGRLQGPELSQQVWGLTFESPVGIAAGFDKNALLVPLYRAGLFGLGFAEIGSVSAKPAAGNARPRCWRIPSDDVVVNAMGLNNEGSDALAQRLREMEATSSGQGQRPVGVNIAKTHDPSILGPAAVEDFVQSFRTLSPLADFVVLNVSCPNTTEGKTFEEPDALAGLLSAVAKEVRGRAKPPILVKLMATPDSEEGRRSQKELLNVIEASGIVDGLVISNTIKNPEVQLSPEGRAAADAIGKGGVSGRVIHQRSVAAIRSAYQATGGRLTIIGVGGTDSAEAAYEKIRAGASLVEVYTGLVYKGPGLFQDVQTGLRRLLERDGFNHIGQAIGIDIK